MYVSSIYKMAYYNKKFDISNILKNIFVVVCSYKKCCNLIQRKNLKCRQLTIFLLIFHGYIRDNFAILKSKSIIYRHNCFSFCLTVNTISIFQTLFFLNPSLAQQKPKSILARNYILSQNKFLKKKITKT